MQKLEEWSFWICCCIILAICFFVLMFIKLFDLIKSYLSWIICFLAALPIGLGIYVFLSNRTEMVNNITDISKTDSINIIQTVGAIVNVTQIDSSNADRMLDKIFNSKVSRSVPSFTHENSLGDLGDYMGGVAGVMGCFVSIIGLYYVYQTFQQQKKQIAQQGNELIEQNRIQKEHNDAIVSAITSISTLQGNLAKELEKLANSNQSLADYTKDIEEHNKNTASHIASLSKVALTKLNYDIYNSLYEEWKCIEYPEIKRIEWKTPEEAMAKEKESINQINNSLVFSIYFLKFWAICKFIRSNFTKQEIETKAIFHTLINGLSEDAKYIIFQNLLYSKDVENAKIANEYNFFSTENYLVANSTGALTWVEGFIVPQKRFSIIHTKPCDNLGADDWKTYQNLANS